MLLRKIKQVLATILFKEGDDIDHLLFLYNREQLNKFLTMGKLSSGLMHDLFTPISSLLLIIDHLEKTGVLDNHELKSSLLSSRKNLGEFVTMIHEFLKEENKVEKTNVSDLVEQSIRFLGYKIKELNIKIYFLRQNNIQITTNKLRFFQVLINIISNAINSHKKSSDDKKVSINISENISHIKIKVIDNGFGISKKIMEQIYSPLFTTRDKGTGLGLFTTKEIIEKELGGKISIESKEGEGTIVLIKIPKNTPRGVF